MRFSLSKWYLDCVAESGDAVVLYWASLRWGVARLQYGAALLAPAAGTPVHRYTLRPESEPVAVADDTLIWSSERLGARGTWTRRADSIRRNLLSDDRGSIDWHCICPRADAVIQIGDRTITGSGYAEHLTMTLKPWRLPLDELRWGRFLAPDDAMVWIGWDGPSPRTWVWVNGSETRDAMITAHGVEMPGRGMALSVGGGRVLRTGRLVRTALQPLSAVAGLIPRWRHANETKWVARGTVRSPIRVINGWVVHEVVTWA